MAVTSEYIENDKRKKEEVLSRLGDFVNPVQKDLQSNTSAGTSLSAGQKIAKSAEQNTSQQAGGYNPSDAVNQALERLNAARNGKPGEYTNRWQEQMDATLQDILSRKDFQYDVNADPLYQQYRDQYMRNGQMAMGDTMGQAAQLTGGYGNSYAMQAGQQAYNGYMQGLNDKIPELYSLAMQAYNNQTNDMMNRYNLMGTAENSEYGRYQDSMSAYNTELDRLLNQYNTERSYDYGMYRDTVSDQQQQWANAWAMFQAGQDTPEIRQILGLPEKAAGGGGGGGSGSRGGSGGNVNLISEATKVAQALGAGSAMQYIQEQTGGVKSPTSVMAQANAKGVAQTQRYKNYLAAMGKK